MAEERLAAVERGAHEAGLSALDVDAPQIQINGELHVRVVRDRTTYIDAESFDGVVIHRRIDFWHAVEKLSAAAHVLVAKDVASSLLARWKLALLNRSHARAAILQEPIESGKEHVRS